MSTQMSTQTKQLVLWMLRMPHNFWMLDKFSAEARPSAGRIASARSNAHDFHFLQTRAAARRIRYKKVSNCIK
jgi:hypothetical protein